MATQELLNSTLSPDKKIFFISDLHLGSPDDASSLLRERKLIRFFESVEADAQAIFLVGDIFDFWFEYKEAVPKGFIRFLAKLAMLKEKGIDIYIFSGNHDMWMKDYLEQEIGAKVFHGRMELQAGDTSVFIAHGDGLGPGDIKYKILKKIFSNKLCQWLFGWLHPDIGIKIAKTWSRGNYTDPVLEVFHGEDKEWLIQYCKRKLQERHYDYFVMGHRHLPMDIRLSDKSRYINLGDWMLNCNYAEFDGKEIKLIKFEEAK
jgi:UDP-2,3-diacylglucosamine hydrolase